MTTARRRMPAYGRLAFAGPDAATYNVASDAIPDVASDASSDDSDAVPDATNRLRRSRQHHRAGRDFFVFDARLAGRDWCPRRSALRLTAPELLCHLPSRWESQRKLQQRQRHRRRRRPRHRQRKRQQHRQRGQATTSSGTHGGDFDADVIANLIADVIANPVADAIIDVRAIDWHAPERLRLAPQPFPDNDFDMFR